MEKRLVRQDHREEWDRGTGGVIFDSRNTSSKNRVQAVAGRGKQRGRRDGEHGHAAHKLHLRRDRVDYGHRRDSAAPVEGDGLHRQQHPHVGNRVAGHLDELHLSDYRPHAVQDLRLHVGPPTGHTGCPGPDVPGHLPGLAVMHCVLLWNEVHHLCRGRSPCQGWHSSLRRGALHPHGPVRAGAHLLDRQLCGAGLL